ncbi:MAG: carboxypeptidase-like regulatory domain-containing protein [Edaphobacter sp.]|uniref:TonB-dependent receptor n=1 Tax=Edaphobacter sp. TaxID=1934404 RepID=UPI002385E57E|nr:carboxypeptidase-like regulatory domain-containing protein [Edaphobacter sp.]MDE1176916.1 carboxypeptidase-like regulatory domain-containing protein [Edaphobacter sp.]
MIKKHPLLLGIFVFLVLLSTSPLRAQLSTTATITGTVTDSTGAVIPGAAVTVEANGTRTQATSTSNGQGVFVLPGLGVDRYSLSVKMDGFQSYKTTGIELHPAATVTVNIQLQNGSSSQSVEVSAAPPMVETQTSDKSANVEGAQLSTLPLNGRNYQGMATMMPGVQNTSAGTGLTSGGRSTNNTLSVNGMQQNKTFYALDGVWNENTGNMNQQSVIPNPDSLEEVKVLQNNFSTKYSLLGSSVVLLQTKSGTSNFHGTVWEFLRNDKLNSKPYFANSVLPYKQNIFGYNIGGPVTIPGLYNNKRNKTFFFWSQQFVRLNQVPTNLLGVTPTANQRAGIFTSPIKDPTTGLNFAQNSAGQYVVPTSAMNANAVAYLNALYPLPNYNSGGTQNYLNNQKQVTNQRDDEIKIDHNFNQNYHLLGEYLDEYQEYKQNSLNSAQSGEVFNVNSETDYTHNKLAQVALTQILTPNLVNTTSIAMNIFDLDLDLVGTTTNDQVSGFTTNQPYNGYLSTRLPLVTFSGGISPQGIPASRPLTHAADLDNTVGDDFSWLHGRHYFQGGLTVVFNTKRQNVATATNGQYTFTGNFTKPTTGGVTLDDALADFLLGKATTFTQSSDQIRVPVHGMSISPYFEDRMKVTKNVTVTAGLRAYWMPLPQGPRGTQTIFDPSAYLATQAPIVNANGSLTTTAGYNPLNGLLANTGHSGGLPRNYSNAHNWYFGPQFGVAWDVFGDGKTSFRGGYGITFTRIFSNQDCSFQCASNPPSLSTVNLQNPAFANPVGTGTTAPATIQTLNNADLNIQATQVHTYSASLEHQFPHTWIASVTGAASQARHMLGTWNYNQAPHTGAYDFNPAINTGTVTPYYYAPYQGYGAITTFASRNNQNWNALEVNVKHPVSDTLFLTFAYTYSHDLTDYTSGTYNVIDPYNPSRYYGNAEGLDFRHSASLTAIYNLPFFRKGNLAERTLLGGWKYSDITTLRSGTALSPGLSIANQGNAMRPNLVVGQSTAGPKSQDQWFNTSAFAAPAAGYYGNAGTGILRGPGLILFDMSLYKEFHFTDSRFLEIRGEAFNVFNHTNFTTISTSYGAATFGQATAAADPRIFELAARFKF